MSSSPSRLHHRTCHLCEAMCGVTLEVVDGVVGAIRGDSEDPFSRGHICPKAAALGDLHDDPDRLRRPLRRTLHGWREIGWDEAFREVADHLVAIREAHGVDAVATYFGNPTAHNYGMLLHLPALMRALGSRNRFSASSVDQLPHQLAAYLMFGHQWLQPVPDIDHSDFLVILGANPVVSNGSMMSAPGMRQRLKELRDRGGRLVVVDPRRSETAQLADTHLFIRPGTDALLLAAMLCTLLEERLIDPGRLVAHTEGLGDAVVALESFGPALVAGVVGQTEAVIRALARDLAKAKSAVVYGRMGCSTQPFGTLCQWLINLLNLATGNLDRRGGAMFPLPAFDLAGPGSRPGHFGKWRSRVRGLPEFAGELPVAALSEEMLTPGPGQIKALLTFAGNPVLSTPEGSRLASALAGLDYMVAVDPYLNETSRHAKLILPPASALERDHYDLVFHALAVRNTARYCPPLFDKPAESRHDWEILAGLTAALAQRQGQPPPECVSPERMLDAGLRAGPYGARRDGEEGLDLAKLRSHAHGLDLGPLQPQLPGRLGHEPKRIQCAPKAMLEDLIRLEDFMHLPQPALCLIGRRLLRSNNSWMHNLPRLTKGKQLCTLQMHPLDAHLRGLIDRQEVTVQSAYGSISATLEVSEEVMPGVVSLPHGFGHQGSELGQKHAGEVPGASINDLTGCERLDLLSGNAALNGTPVEVEG